MPLIAQHASESMISLHGHPWRGERWEHSGSYSRCWFNQHRSFVLRTLQEERLVAFRRAPPDSLRYLSLQWGVLAEIGRFEEPMSWCRVVVGWFHRRIQVEGRPRCRSFESFEGNDNAAIPNRKSTFRIEIDIQARYLRL